MAEHPSRWRAAGLFLSLVLSLVAGGHLAGAMTTAPARPAVCPLTGQVFEFAGVGSGTAFWTRMDFRPEGAIVAPWPVPVCPDESKFPVFKENFSAEEVTRIKAIARTPEYRALVAEDWPTYAVIAFVRRRLGYDPALVASDLLSAAWEAERRVPKLLPGSWHAENEPDLRRRRAQRDACRRQARDAFAELAAAPNRASELTAKARYLEIELSRQLGDFPRAQAGLDRFAASGVPKAGEVSEAMLDQERDLVAHRYLGPAWIGRPSPWNDPVTRVAIRSSLKDGEIEQEIRIAFPTLLKTFPPGNLAQPVPLLHSRNGPAPPGAAPRTAGPGSMMQESPDGSIKMELGVLLAKAPVHEYRLCGYLDVTDANGSRRRVEVADRGAIGDAGGRTFRIARQNRLFFLEDITEDRPRIATQAFPGGGCTPSTQ